MSSVVECYGQGNKEVHFNVVLKNSSNSNYMHTKISYERTRENSLQVRIDQDKGPTPNAPLAECKVKTLSMDLFNEKAELTIRDLNLDPQREVYLNLKNVGLIVIHPEAHETFLKLEKVVTTKFIQKQEPLEETLEYLPIWRLEPEKRYFLKNLSQDYIRARLIEFPPDEHESTESQVRALPLAKV